MIINEYNGQEMYWTDIVKKFPDCIVCMSDYENPDDTELFRGKIESIVTTIQERDAESMRLYKEGKKIYWNNTGEVSELWGLL